MSWRFNGLPVPHQNIEQNLIGDCYSLTIYQIRPEHLGHYSLNVENPWGKITCTAEVFFPMAQNIGKSTVYRLESDVSQL